jgi:oligopeptide transport system substrate-binding protein
MRVRENFGMALRATLAIAALLIATACSDSNNSSTNDEASPVGGSAQEVVLHRGNGAEVESLDPALADTSWEQWIIGDLMLGLFTEDASGNAILGAAENAAVSPDGKMWTFTLRDSLWSDGTPVTAEDFVYAWRRTLDPKTAGKYGAILYAFKNAKAVAEGKLAPSQLGVRSEGTRTLILELEHPAPYLPELLAHNITYPVPRHVIEAKGPAWTQPGNYVSNGPYVLTERIPNDHVTLTKNPRFFDAGHVQIDRVVFYPTEDASGALKRFRAGELDTQNPFPADQIDWLRTNMPAALRQTPTLAIDYVVFNERRKPFDDVRVREALDLAFDRDVLTNKIYRLGEEPAYSIIPRGIANYPGGAGLSFRDLSYAERLTRAQTLMRQAGYGPDRPLHTTYATPSQGDARRAAVAIQAMWRAIYVDVQIVQSETQVNYTKLREGDFDIGAGAWAADFDDASNFLMILTSGNPQNYGGYSNPAFDALYEKADQERDVDKRGQILLQAEKIALNDHAWIPRNFRANRTIVQPYVKGWVANARDVNRTRWLSIDEASRHP